MILKEKTLSEFGIDIDTSPKFSRKNIWVKCDICGIEFQKSSNNVFMCRKNYNTDIDVCKDITCIKKKRENTMVKRYGVVNAGLSPEIRKKVQETCLSKFGTLEAMSSVEVQNKSKDACIKKYGVENVFSSLEIIKKIKKSNLQKYGIEYSKSSNIVKNNTRNNNIKKYGVKNPMMLPRIAKKVSITWCGKIYDEFLKNPLIIPLFTKDEFMGFNNVDFSSIFLSQVNGFIN